MTMDIMHAKMAKVNQIVLHELIYNCNAKLLADSNNYKKQTCRLP